jgi:hypothetical protein
VTAKPEIDGIRKQAIQSKWHCFLDSFEGEQAGPSVKKETVGGLVSASIPASIGNDGVAIPIGVTEGVEISFSGTRVWAAFVNLECFLTMVYSYSSCSFKKSVHCSGLPGK